jgi:two-component system phosphate regulon sensor histidine kinase PhoR
MAGSRTLTRRIGFTALIIAAPWLVALALLAAFGAVSFATAMVIAVLAGGASFVLIRQRAGGLALLADYVNRRLAGQDAEPPTEDVAEPIAELALGIARLERQQSRASMELRGRIATASAVLEALPEPLVVLDPQRRARGANRTARALLGEDVVGQGIANFFRNPAILDAVETTYRSGRGASVEIELGTTVKRRFKVQIETIAGEDVEGPLVILLLLDVTEMRRAEQMRADFVANASHELRTPLSALIGFIETLQGPAKDDAAARDRFLPLMLDQATRMSRLVNDLLSLSRIEMREHALPTDRVDLLPLVRSAIAMFEIGAREKRVTIRLVPPSPDLAADTWVVTGDGEEITQIFVNLLSNAVKFTRADTAIEITIGLHDKQPPDLARPLALPAVSVTVRDQGEGIAHEHLPRLTERFYRVDTARSRKLGGTGLGLAIVKHIVNRHRGALAIHSTLGQGSEFTVYLPRHGNPA